MSKVLAKWKLVKLGDCCKVVSGSTPRTNKPEYWNGSIDWVTPKDLSNLKDSILQEAPQKITEEGYESCSTHLLPKGAILFSSRAPIGLVAITGKEMCTNQGFKSLIPNSDVHSPFLYWCMRYFTPQIAFKGSGSTFKEVSKKIISDFQIPLPPLEEQKRIAEILDRADAIRQKRKRAIELTEQLARSTFLDMFGDPVTNPKGWDTKAIGQISDVTKLAGFEYTQYVKYQEDGEIIALRALNVKKGKLNLNDVKFISQKTSNKLTRSKLHKGDVVMTYIGVNIGEVAIIDKDNTYHLAPNIAKITPYSEVNSTYLMWCLSFHKKQFDKHTTNTAKQALNMGKIRNIIIGIPPLALQNKFQKEIVKIDQLKLKNSKSIRESNNLFNSLLQRAFKGEL